PPQQQNRAHPEQNARNELSISNISNTKKGLSLAYKTSKTGLGATLYLTGLVGSGALKTALFGPAAVVALPSYALGRYTAASVRWATNHIKNRQIDPNELKELNHDSGLKTAIGCSLVPLAAGVTLDGMSLAVISVLFWKITDVGEQLLEGGLEINVDPKILDKIHQFRVITEYDVRVTGLMPKKAISIGIE
ncbi:MAG: hypothetical protein L7U87_08610, partial [Chlamydiales bacterium]|nr:hypothetical protein [Chlamydiales bacterium]